MRKNSFKKISQAGFTLVEIVIVLAIIASMSTLGYLGFKELSTDQSLNNTFGDLSNNLFEAKQNTLSQIDFNSTCSTGGRNLIGYQISPASNKLSYTLQLVCGTDSTDTSTWTYNTVKTVTLDKNTNISAYNIVTVVNPDNTETESQVDATTPILFKAPNALVDKRYLIEIIGDGGIKTLQVSTTGAILQ